MIMDIIIILSFLIGLGITLISYPVTLYYLITCRKKCSCKKDNCPIRQYCSKTAQSNKEKENIQSLKKELAKYSESIKNNTPYQTIK